MYQASLPMKDQQCELGTLRQANTSEVGVLEDVEKKNQSTSSNCSYLCDSVNVYSYRYCYHDPCNHHTQHSWNWYIIV